ncbi:hypothetical protein [Streptomyces cinnamoneus]|uniref:hypothetical protein n=1 Tax=Streptomyces cinnamoneus TaxID=53446 RepID=UPI003799A8CF
MTSRTGTDGHPEVAEISALSEGVLPPSRTAVVREHLADCELCEDVRTSLDEIRGLLGTLPGPVRMPADVAGRIDAALAAEALLDATAPDTADADASTETADAVSRETTSAVSRETAKTAATSTSVSRETTADGSVRHQVVPQGPALREAADRPAGRSRATTGPGRQNSPGAGPRTRPARRWPRALLGTACAAAVLGVGGFFLQSSGDSDPHAGSPAPGESQPTVLTLASGNLETRVHELLQGSKAAESRGMSAQNSPETTLRDFGAPTTPDCVRDGIKRPEPALAIGREKYRGEDAYLVVLPHMADSTLVDAYVVSSSCETTQARGQGKVLLNRTLPRS